MAAGRYSFVIEQGATTNFELRYTDSTGTPVDLTGCQARMQIRPNVASTDILLSLSSSLQSDGTGLNFSGSSNLNPPTSGTIAVYISATTSSLLSFDQAVYDLELVSGTTVTRLLEGQVKLSKEVTR